MPIGAEPESKHDQRVCLRVSYGLSCSGRKTCILSQNCGQMNKRHRMVHRRDTSGRRRSRNDVLKQMTAGREGAHKTVSGAIAVAAVCSRQTIRTTAMFDVPVPTKREDIISVLCRCRAKTLSFSIDKRFKPFGIGFGGMGHPKAPDSGRDHQQRKEPASAVAISANTTARIERPPNLSSMSFLIGRALSRRCMLRNSALSSRQARLLN